MLAGQATAAIGSVAVTCLLTHWLTPADFGIFALGLTASNVGQMILFGPWAGSAMRFDSVAAADGAMRSFVRTVLAMQWRLTMAAIGLAVLIDACLALSGHQRLLPLAGATAILVIASAWAALASALQSARRQRAIIAIHQGASPFLRLLLTGLLIHVLSADATVTMTAWALAALIISWSQWRFIPRRDLPSDPPRSSDYRGRMIAYAAPFVLWGIFACAQACADRWSLRWAADLATVGIYSTAFQLGYAPALLLGSFVEQMLVPVAFSGAGDALDQGRLERARRRVLIAASVLIAAALAGAGTLWLCRPLIALVLPSTYSRSIDYVAPLFLAGGLFAAAQVLIIAPLAGFNSRSVLLPKIATAVLAVVVLIGSATSWGVVGLVAGQVSVSLLFCLWSAHIAVRRTGGGPPEEVPA